MKQKFVRCSACTFVTFILIVMMLSLSTVGFSEALNPVATIAFDKISLQLGETLIANYEIENIDDYSSIYATWYCESNNNWQGNHTQKLTALQGELTFTPTFGKSIFLKLEITDSIGRWFEFDSSAIPLFGEQTTPPSVTFAFNKTSAQMGEKVTANYKIEGVDDTNAIYATWYCESINENWQGNNTQKLTSLQGKLDFTPTFGKALYLNIGITDSNGQWYEFNSTQIPLYGDQTIPPTVNFSFDKASLQIGEKITVQYKIDGPDIYQSIYATWYCENNNNWQGNNPQKLNNLQGELSFVPLYGKALCINLDVTDSKGQWFGFVSDQIPLSGSTTSLLNNYVAVSTNEVANETMLFYLDADYKKFQSILIDGEMVPSSCYKVWSGSTNIELTKEFYSSLSNGEHTLLALFSDGYAKVSFEKNSVSSPPKTGDEAPFMLWLSLILLSLFGLHRCKLQSKVVN